MNKSTTSLIQSITQGTGDKVENFAYTYDDVGNITSVTRNGITTTYEYDKLGQLTRTNDPFDKTASEDGTTWLYIYDQGGNIQKKCYYPLTINATLLEPTDANSITYTYGNPNWKDQLTAYDGKSITYDAIGNPLNDGTWTYEWQNGRQLKSMTQGTPNTAGYKKLDSVYNADGLRIQKKYTEYDTETEQNNITVTDYILHGKNIIYIRNIVNNVQQYTLHYFYDAQGRPALFSHITSAGETYYTLVHNLQGDIVGIRDASGNEVVRYTYDAWGKLLSATGDLAVTLGYINSFRYRGYMYDEESELYYLRSRYYNSSRAKFVSEDILINSGAALLNHNQFSYCFNSPIQNADANGKAAFYACCYGDGGGGIKPKSVQKGAPMSKEELDALLLRISSPFPYDTSSWIVPSELLPDPPATLRALNRVDESSKEWQVARDYCFSYHVRGAIGNCSVMSNYSVGNIFRCDDGVYDAYTTVSFYNRASKQQEDYCVYMKFGTVSHRNFYGVIYEAYVALGSSGEVSCLPFPLTLVSAIASLSVTATEQSYFYSYDPSNYYYDTLEVVDSLIR